MKSIIEYEPLDGFFDLRNFDLTSKEFKSCWNIKKLEEKRNEIIRVTKSFR